MASKTNSDSPASKKARAKEAENRKKRIVAQGGKRKMTLLSPEAHAVLKAETERTQESETAVINRALLALAK